MTIDWETAPTPGELARERAYDVARQALQIAEHNLAFATDPDMRAAWRTQVAKARRRLTLAEQDLS